MRTAFYILLITSLSACLPKPVIRGEQKVKSLIRHYMDSCLVAPETYEPVSFEKVVTVMSTFYDSPDFENLPIEGRIQAISDSTSDYPAYRLRKGTGYYREMDQVRMAAMISLQKSHVPKFKYYSVVHHFKADRDYPKVTSHLSIFRIDSSFTRVIEVINRGGAFKREIDPPGMPGRWRGKHWL